MLKKQNFYKLALFIMIIGLLAASFVLTPRLGLESSNKVVSQAVCHRDCYELIKMAGNDTKDIEDYFETENNLYKEMKAVGINTVIVHDATLERLARTGAVGLTIEKGKVIVRETHDKIFDEVVEGVMSRYKKQIKVQGQTPDRVLEFSGSTVPADLHGNLLNRAVQQLPLGIMSHEIKRFAKLGFNIIVAPENFPQLTESDVRLFWKRIRNTGVEVIGVMHGGYQMFGYPKFMKTVAEEMGRLPLILQEHSMQLGFTNVQGNLEMSKYCGYNVIRAFTIDYNEMKELSVDTALRRWAIADDERNIRLNIITPTLKGENLIQTNLDYVAGITESVKKRGFTIGIAKPMDVYFPNRFLLIPVIAGIIAAAILLLQSIFNWSFNKSLLLWGVATGIGLFENFVAVTLTHQVLALVAGITFPVLSVYRITDMLDSIEDVALPKIIANIFICLVICTFLSLCGATMLAAIMTDARFILEIDFYRGVKLTFIVPLIIMVVLSIKKYDLFGLNNCSDFREMLGNILHSVKECFSQKNIFKTFLFLVIFGFVVFVFIARTGHALDIPIPDFELAMRHWMEDNMYARPREKEFLIGHVAFCLLVFAMHKGWSHMIKILLTVVALIGQVSLVETFCHMRSPFLMSVARALGGLAFGLILGIMVVLIVHIYLDFRKRAAENE